MTARVVKVLEDGKLTLSIREKAYLQIQKDAEKIEKLLDSYEGSLPLTIRQHRRSLPMRPA